MQSGREDTLEERYTIKFCLKLGKNATETYEFSDILRMGTFIDSIHMKL